MISVCSFLPFLTVAAETTHSSLREQCANLDASLISAKRELSLERQRFDDTTSQLGAAKDSEAKQAAKCKALRARVHHLQAQLRGEVPLDDGGAELLSNGRCVLRRCNMVSCSLWLYLPVSVTATGN